MKIRLPRVLAVTVLLAAGCGGGSTVPGHDAGAGGGGSGVGGTGTTTSSTVDPCGQCIPVPPWPGNGPALVWYGDEKDAPDCPPEVPHIGYEGYADLDVTHDCGTCACGAPSGSCTLPQTMTANAATCALNNASTPHTPFDPTAGWAGACDADTSIASGKLCSGVPCVKSLTIGPLGVTEGACMPSTPPPQAPPKWKTFVRGCMIGAHYCDTVVPRVCLPDFPKERGFHTCVFANNMDSCAELGLEPYTEEHIFYMSYDDTRGCNPCTCGNPTGGSCSSSVSVFTDGACSTPAYTATVTSAGSDCHDLPSGSPLGSKSATAPVYAPGACTPGGGEPTGGVVGAEASTVCCIPLL